MIGLLGAAGRHFRHHTINAMGLQEGWNKLGMAPLTPMPTIPSIVHLIHTYIPKAPFDLRNFRKAFGFQKLGIDLFFFFENLFKEEEEATSKAFQFEMGLES